MNTTTDDLIAEIESAAKAATPAQWSLTVHTNPVDRFDAQADDWTISAGGKQVVAEEDGIRNHRDVRYIAAANPANVLALIAELRSLRADAERFRHLIFNHVGRAKGTDDAILKFGPYPAQRLRATIDTAMQAQKCNQ